MKAISISWTTYSDHNTGARFMPVLDKQSGIYIGVADVDEEQADDLAKRGFMVLSDEEFADGLKQVEAQVQAESDAASDARNESGDPLLSGIVPPAKVKTDDPAKSGDPQPAGPPPPPPPGA